MKDKVKYYIIGIVIILLSSPLGYMTVNIIFGNKNLAREFEVLLNGFIHSYMLIGILIFSIGIIKLFIEKKNINKREVMRVVWIVSMINVQVNGIKSF